MMLCNTCNNVCWLVRGDVMGSDNDSRVTWKPAVRFSALFALDPKQARTTFLQIFSQLFKVVVLSKFTLLFRDRMNVCGRIGVVMFGKLFLVRFLAYTKVKSFQFWGQKYVRHYSRRPQSDVSREGCDVIYSTHATFLDKNTLKYTVRIVFKRRFWFSDLGDRKWQWKWVFGWSRRQEFFTRLLLRKWFRATGDRRRGRGLSRREAKRGRRGRRINTSLQPRCSGIVVVSFYPLICS